MMVGVPVLFCACVCACWPFVWVMGVVVGVCGVWWCCFQYCVAVVFASRRVPGVLVCVVAGACSGVVWLVACFLVVVVAWLGFGACVRGWGARVGVGVVGWVCVSRFRMLTCLGLFLVFGCCLLFVWLITLPGVVGAVVGVCCFGWRAARVVASSGCVFLGSCVFLGCCFVLLVCVLVCVCVWWGVRVWVSVCVCGCLGGGCVVGGGVVSVWLGVVVAGGGVGVSFGVGSRVFVLGGVGVPVFSSGGVVSVLPGAGVVVPLSGSGSSSGGVVVAGCGGVVVCVLCAARVFGGGWCFLVLRRWARAAGVGVAKVVGLLGSVGVGGGVGASLCSCVLVVAFSPGFASASGSVSSSSLSVRSLADGGGRVGVGFGACVRGWGARVGVFCRCGLVGWLVPARLGVCLSASAGRVFVGVLVGWCCAWCFVGAG